MLKTITFLCAITCLSGLVYAVDLDEKVSHSRAAVKSYGTALKSELVSAMKSGGPINAVAVCNIAAPKIARSVSTEKGLEISRTSLKFRNPANAPTDWQHKILQDFNVKKDAGQDPATLEYAEVVATTTGQEYRYMKAIPTGKVCLNCHGSSLPVELSEKIKSFYPEDKATGFSIGDIRGAFVVTEKMD